MSKIIKGNFKTKKVVEPEVNPEDKDSLEAEFEKEALNKLGGSIAYVSRKRVMWAEKENLTKKNSKKEK